VPEVPEKDVVALIQFEYETALGEQAEAVVEKVKVPEFKPEEDTVVELEPSV